MIGPSLVIGFGILVGIQHAFEPDHISAISTQILKSRFTKTSKKRLIKNIFRKSSLLGVVWGAGHTTSLILIGFLIYGLSANIGQTTFVGFEMIAITMLIFLGISTITNKKINFKHRHPHTHSDGKIHFDKHIHDDSEHTHTHKSYFIGVVHGFAGSGSLVVLSALTMYEGMDILGFIAIFGIGSIIGMSIIGGLIGIPFAVGNKFTKIQKIFRYAVGITSVVIGINLILQIDFAMMNIDFKFM